MSFASGVSFDARTAAFMAAITIPDDDTIYYPSTAFEIDGHHHWLNVNKLYKNLDDAGITPKLKFFHPKIGGTAARQARNLINPADTDAAYRITFYNTVAGDFDAEGWKPNGTNAHAATWFIPSLHLDAENDSAMGFYSQQDLASSGTYQMGSFYGGSSPCIGIGINKGANSTFDNNRYQTNRITVTGLTDSLGLWTVSRTGQYDLRAYKRDTQKGINTLINGNLNPLSQILMGCINIGAGLNVVPLAYSAMKMSIDYCGSGLTPAQVTDMNSICEEFETSFFRNK